MDIITYREAIRESMHSALKTNSNSLIYGLGVTDHTGIFGTTLGLEDEFGGQRVFDTPISEDSMTGFALGLSLSGIYPIHIHIRNDFMLLAMNQIVNSIAKYRYTYGGSFQAPMLIRSVIGRSWGQGAQHSQSLQSLFGHIPGLTVVMPSSASRVLETYDYAVNHYPNPVISLEHRLLYDYKFKTEGCVGSDGKSPLSSYLVREGKDVTVVATSIMVEESLRAANYAMGNEGIEMEVIDLHCITHPDTELILQSVKKTGKLIVADTSWAAFGVCAEVSRLITKEDPAILRAPIKEISMAKSPCPTAKILENYFYANLGNIVDSAYELYFGSKKHQKKLPTQEYILDQYKLFKGPF
jgi:acetoin:2,6-dichlorophenolindophenol oxidoreductase subunit beta